MYKNGRHEALWFCGGGKGSGHAIIKCLRGPSYQHSPAHSTMQYIKTYPSPTTLDPSKYHIYSLRRPTKNLKVICMILLTKHDFIYKMLCVGGGRKKPEKIKNSPFGCPPIPLLRYGGQPFSGVRECRKTSRTYPKWEGEMI